MTLTEDERKSALWLKLEEHLKMRQKILREQNDHHQFEHDTAILRGRIAEISMLLLMSNPPDRPTEVIHYESP